MNVMTAHLHVDDDADPESVLRQAQAVVGEGFGLSHATLQVERTASEACHEITW